VFKKTHIIYLTFMNYAIVNINLLPHMLRIAGKDLWISTLLSSLIGVFAVWLLWDLERHNPEQTLLDMLKSRKGKWVRFVFLTIVILYLFIQCLFTTAFLTEFISIGFISETPLWVIAGLFAASIAYALYKGMMPIANLAGILTFSTVLSGTAMAVSLTGHRDFENFLPIAEFGLRPILLGALLFIPIWTELLFIGLLPREFIGSTGWLKAYLAIVAFNTLVFLGHADGPITAYGVEQAENFNFPMLSTAKVISLGIIDRFDVYGLALMMFGSFIRVAFYYNLAITQVYSLISRADTTVPIPLAIASGIALTFGTVWLFRDVSFFHSLFIPYVIAGIGMFGLFFLLYLFLRITSPKFKPSP